MAKKDVENYFKEVCNQYHELLDSLHDMEKEAMEGLINPDRLEQLKTIIEPIKTNYVRISYIMFLLNKPTKVEEWLSKIGIKTNKVKYAEKILIEGKDGSLDIIKEENESALKKMKNQSQRKT